MAKSAPRLFRKSKFLVLDVAATLEAPNTCFASYATKPKTHKIKVLIPEENNNQDFINWKQGVSSHPKISRGK